jgi:phosphate butyryltransferase
LRTFDEVKEAILEYPVKRVAVACAAEASVLAAAAQATEENIAGATLVGEEKGIRRIAEENGVSVEPFSIIDEADEVKAVLKATELVSSGKADILMKGHIHTDDFLRGVLDKQIGLRTPAVMSHVFMIETPGRNNFLYISDGAMNIAPDLEGKAEIILNAVHLASVFGLERPRVGVLAAVEVVNPKMQATVDAAVLGTMNLRRQFSPRCVIDGPFALDNAVSLAAAEIKGITGDVAGQADILIVPDIEAGNILVKALVYFAHLRVAGVLVGAKAPVVLTSRADNADAKLNSIAAAVYLCNTERRLKLKIGKVHY